MTTHASPTPPCSSARRATGTWSSWTRRAARWGWSRPWISSEPSGLPAQHPAALPHLDTKTGLIWTDDTVLDMAHIGAAPDGPGLIMLVHDAPGVPRRVVWAESAANVFTRLTDMLALPQESPELSRWLEKPARLRFRVAVAFDTAALDRGLAEAVREKERAAALSGGCCRQER